MKEATCQPLVALVCLAMVAQATASGTYAPPRTPWGDPDLQGVYTNKYELGYLHWSDRKNSRDGGSRA